MNSLLEGQLQVAQAILAIRATHHFQPLLIHLLLHQLFISQQWTSQWELDIPGPHRAFQGGLPVSQS